MTTDVELFLAHYGQKGMKWGVVNEKKPSGHRVRLESQYRKRGFNKEQAAARADKRIKTEKVLAVVGGAAVVGLAAYGAKVAIGKRFSDVVLGADTDLHYINAMGSDKIDLDRRLYTTFEKADTDKYRGLLAQTRRKQSRVFGEDPSRAVIYDTVLRAKGEIKAPSHMQAKAMYKEFLKDRGQPYFGGYNEFNKSIVADTPASKDFMEFVKKKGYNALLDANDQFISGYNTKKPLIVFNAESSLVKHGESVVSKQLAKKLGDRQLAMIYTKQLAPVVGLGALAITGRKAMDTHDKYQVVNDYMLKHPETKRDYADIYGSLRVGADGTYKIRSIKGSTT